MEDQLDIYVLLCTTGVLLVDQVRKSHQTQVSGG